MRTHDEGDSIHVSGEAVDGSLRSTAIGTPWQGTLESATKAASAVLDKGYQIGLNRVREAVISSHFMQRISQDMRLHLYDAVAAWRSSE